MMSNVWTSECDPMAELAGMPLERRSEDGQGNPVHGGDSESHVSVWRKPA